MTRLKWLQLTPVVAAVTSFSVTAVAADDPPTKPNPQVAQTMQPAPAPSPEATPQPATPETAAPSTPPPPPPEPVATAPATSPAPPPPEAEEEKPLPPGSFKVPGTKTTLTLSGYAQFDVTYDFKGRDPQVEDGDWAVHAASLPLDENYEVQQKSGQLYLTARTSRIGISTLTKSDIADIGTKIEGDFNTGNLLSGQTFTNSVLFRLRHAYGTLSGKYGTLLVGQTWSTFLDMPSYSETVDFNGPGSIALIRQPQIRYTIPLGGPITLALAAENGPGTDRNGISDTTGPTRRVQQIPDLIAALGAAGDWGSASVGAVTLQYKNAGTPPVPVPAGAPPGTLPTPGGDSYSKQGWGVRASAALKLPWGDTLRAHAVGGNGIGRYIFNAGLSGQGAVADDAAQDWHLWQAFSYHVNYTHVWSPHFRSNVTWSQTLFKSNEGDPTVPTFSAATAQVTNAPNKRIDQLFVNTYYTVTKQVEFGVEYVFGQRRTFGNDDAANDSCNAQTVGACASQKGTMHRVGASAHFNFF